LRVGHAGARLGDGFDARRRSNLVLAGGVDALSRAPLLFSDAMVTWLANWYAAKTLGRRARVLAQVQARNLAPVIG
jgi:acetyl-CoA C-acetyltransferase